MQGAPDDRRSPSHWGTDLVAGGPTNGLALLAADLLEVVWVVGLKYTDGFTRLFPSALTLAAPLCSVMLLARAFRTIPVGTAYAIWTGIGAVGTAIGGIAFLGESASPARLGSLSVIVAGILALKPSSH